MKLLEKIFATPELRNNPPVLMDIGASGGIHPKWKTFSRHAICIAFDPDKRDMAQVETASGDFKKLYVFDCIATDSAQTTCDFYLTNSPYCSSTLPPDEKGLRDYAFSDLFAVNEKTKLKARTLDSVLKEAKIPQVDWFKTDSQGTDLRLFKNLGAEMIQKVLAAEFEPGFIDAYKGEDKIHGLLRDMDQLPFWLSDFEVRGNQRIPPSVRADFLALCQPRLMDAFQKESPGWAGVTYLNTFEKLHSQRDLLLGWVFAVTEEQFAFAYYLADLGLQKFPNPLFGEMKNWIERKMKKSYLKASSLVAKKAINKVKKLARL